MTTAIEYALLAGASYYDTRADMNRFPVPIGWAKITNPDSHFSDTATGFEAISFTNGTEIVISYAGTGPGSLLSADWVHGNIPLASGNLSDQLRQAADYYLQIKNDPANAGKTISFTGHSLGGGLASLMAVFFGESAFTFDQAPFRASAQGYANDFNSMTDSVAKNLRAYLADHIPVTSLAKLDAYIAALEIFNNPNPIAADTLAAREARVTDINVQGEILSSWLVPFSRIGTQANIPDSANGVAGTDLHSQALLAAFLQSNQTAAPFKNLSDVTVKLPDLLKMIFDPQLFYRDPNKLNNPERNLLEHLVRHEAGVQDSIAADAMVTRFTADLWKLAQDGGLTMSDLNGQPNNYNTWNNVSKALTAFAMQKYYDEKTGSVGVGGTLFQDVSGGGVIQFDTAAVVGTGNSITQAKGYTQYFQNYLDTTSTFTLPERTLIKSLLHNMQDWYIQAGTNGMNATDTLNRGAFMLGNTGADALVGGTGADLLVGNAGTDTLQGGGGNDTLLGGSGNDTYKYNAGDGLDTILYSDGQGGIVMDGATLSGGDQYGDARVHKDANGHLYVDVGSNRLAIDGNIVIEDQQAGELGLNMTGAVADANPATTNTINRDPNRR